MINEKKATKMVGLALAFVLSINFMWTYNCEAAPKEFYYKGTDINYVTKTAPSGKYLGVVTDAYYSYTQYATKCYPRCLTYYYGSGNTWIQNQGQTLSINVTETKTRTVSKGVSGEIGVSGKIVNAKVSASVSTSKTTTYSKGLGLSYDLSRFSHDLYNVADFGNYLKINETMRYRGEFMEIYPTYGIDKKSGSILRLVYKK